jgi:phosphoglycolate phosphatase-like HAD superfamily hydrolase
VVFVYFSNPVLASVGPYNRRTMIAPTLLALDFDGVVCDGRPEYFETAWRAYVEAWPPPALTPGRPDKVAAQFSTLRPLIESGWEMPLLLHALLAGVGEASLANRHVWLTTAKGLMADAGVSAETLGRALNRIRDEWFARDPDGWLSHHGFYPGMVARLMSLADGGPRVVIVTTKAERFVRALMAAQNPRLAAIAVIGREPGAPVPKPVTLRRLADKYGVGADGTGLWFVEDMLETLEATATRPELAGARLFLADWGYNTAEDRARAGAAGRVRRLSLDCFAGPLEAWPG